MKKSLSEFDLREATLLDEKRPSIASDRISVYIFLRSYYFATKVIYKKLFKRRICLSTKIKISRQERKGVAHSVLFQCFSTRRFSIYIQPSN